MEDTEVTQAVIEPDNSSVSNFTSFRHVFTACTTSDKSGFLALPTHTQVICDTKIIHSTHDNVRHTPSLRSHQATRGKQVFALCVVCDNECYSVSLQIEPCVRNHSRYHAQLHTNIAPKGLNEALQG